MSLKVISKFRETNVGKGKESDPTDTWANALTSLQFYNVCYALAVRRWRVGDSLGPYGTFAILNIPFPNGTEMSSTENFHEDSNYEMYF